VPHVKYIAAMKNKIYVAKSTIANAGRGVFAATAIKEDEVIEICPILLLWDDDAVGAGETMLGSYVYEYAENCSMMALGHGSLYNHSDDANAMYELLTHDDKPQEYSELYFVATKPIRKHEEIFINYGNAHGSLYRTTPA
jgi:SET domain-containing protein